MATVDTVDVPEASYAPFVDDRHADLLIYISELALHMQRYQANKADQQPIYR